MIQTIGHMLLSYVPEYIGSTVEPLITDTIGTNDFVRCSKGVLSSGVSG